MHSMLGSDDDRLPQIDIFYSVTTAITVMVHGARMVAYVVLERAVEQVGALSSLSVMMPSTAK